MVETISILHDYKLFAKFRKKKTNSELTKMYFKWVEKSFDDQSFKILCSWTQ